MSGWRLVALWLFLMAGFAHAQVQAQPQPIKMSNADIDGALLARVGVKAESDSEAGALVTEDAEVFLSADRRMDAGIYRSSAARFTIDTPYGVDEFMYFLKGTLTLTSTDGTVTVVNPGEAVTIPKEWTGVWDSTAYTKLYVIYSPNELLPEPARD